MISRYILKKYFARICNVNRAAYGREVDILQIRHIALSVLYINPYLPEVGYNIPQAGMFGGEIVTVANI